jgi:hypothetical protein
MSENAGGWDSMSFAALSERYEDLVQSIKADVAALAEVGPALKAKAAGLGLTIELDYSDVADGLSSLVTTRKRKRGAKAEAPETPRRGARPGRPHRFSLVWRKDGKAVVDDAGAPVVFRNQVTLLRGPKYERLLGNKVGQVQLIDNEAGGAVVVEKLSLAPAPGGRRG